MITSELKTTLGEMDVEFPRTTAAVRGFLAKGEFLSSSLRYLIEREGKDFWPSAERLLGIFREMTQDDYERRLQALERYTYEYLKAQIAYTKRGAYASESFDAVNEAVYANPEVMDGYYLDGLLLSQAFWPGHLRINRFFVDELVGRLPDQARFCEIGVGHGWYFTEALIRQPRATAIGLDISEFSLAYTSELAKARGIESTRFELRKADAREGLGSDVQGLDAAICGEVLEHVDAPDKLARTIRDALRPGGHAYFTAPAMSDAIDHLYEFKSAGAIRDLVTQAGLRVIASEEIAVTQFDMGGRAWDPTVLVCLVAIKEPVE